MIDLDELLQRDSGAHRPADPVRRVRGLPARREAQELDRLRRRLSGHDRIRLRCRQGLVGPRRRAQQACSSATSRPIRATSKSCPAWRPVAVPLRAQGEADRRAERPEPRRATGTPSATAHPASVRGARRTALVNARLFERQRQDAEASRRSPRSAAKSRRCSISMSCSSRIAQLDQARRRLPHVRHPAAQRDDAASSR